MIKSNHVNMGINIVLKIKQENKLKRIMTILFQLKRGLKMRKMMIKLHYNTKQCKDYRKC